MKTLETCLEGVTAGGEWSRLGARLQIPGVGHEIEMDTANDAAYAARACSSFPALVRALEKQIKACSCEGTGKRMHYAADYNCPECRHARAALAEALKD